MPLEARNLIYTKHFASKPPHPSLSPPIIIPNLHLLYWMAAFVDKLAFSVVKTLPVNSPLDPPVSIFKTFLAAEGFSDFDTLLPLMSRDVEDYGVSDL